MQRRVCATASQVFRPLKRTASLWASMISKLRTSQLETFRNVCLAVWWSSGMALWW